MKPLSTKDMKIQDQFWSGYMELIRSHVIPYQWEALNDRVEGAKPSYCMQNFRVASGQEQGTFQGMVFQDSDVYKWLEAVAFSLTWHPDEQLEKTAEEAIAVICAAQQEDGYLDTYYIVNGLDKRFTNLKDHHELYCLGHLTEAAVAYYEATGKRELMDAAIRYIDCVDAHFGSEEGKIHGYPGHEVAEMALVRLYHITKDEKHLALAKYFIDERGKQPLFFEEENKKNGNEFPWADSSFQYQYYQAGQEVRKQETAQGHAVRAVYLYSGMIDVAIASGDTVLFEACERLWNNMVHKQMYITGAIGSSSYGEAFTFDYDLPNDTVYAETCAAIGLIFFARRMFEATKDSKYTDVMERALFNGVISGMSLDGTKFFYVNPLEVVPKALEKDFCMKHVKGERQKWFGCACCPPNVARLLASIANYAYEITEDTFYMNLFVGGSIKTQMGGKPIALKVETNYPWEEQVQICFEQEEEHAFTYGVRIPAWCDEYTILVNGKVVPYVVDKGYALLKQVWKKGDVIKVTLQMAVKLNVANPKVREDIGKVAVSRGPIVYCLEEEDNGALLQKIAIDGEVIFQELFEKDLLKGVVTLTCEGNVLSEESWNDTTLYQEYQMPVYQKKELKWIPYYSWANRNVGEMIVWVRLK